MPKMGLWLFHRKTKKRSRSGANFSDPDITFHAVADPLQPRSNTFDPSMMQQPKRQRTVREPNKPHRRGRTYSFSPGRNDSIHLAGRRSRDPHYRNTSHEWQRTPTLARHKSSKRRQIDRSREAEIKAMSHPVPLRPATDHWMAGRPLKKDSRRYKTGIFPRHDNPSSEVSLPSVASLRSSMSSDSEYASWKVSALNSLAPRPTLRYSTTPAYAPVHGSGPERTKSLRRKLSERPAIPEATLRAHKRIDDLADDLSSSDIRELMERDKRRRERRKQKEQERMERRIARQARSQQQQDNKPATNLERGVLGRELVGLGIEPESAVVTSSRPRSPQSSAEPDHAPAPAERSSAESSQRSNPLDQFHRPDSGHIDLPTPPRDSEDLVAENADIVPSPSALPQRKASMNRRKSDRRVLRKKSRSGSPPLTHHNEAAVFPTSLLRQDDTSTTQLSGSEAGASGRASRLSWSAIFKWPGRNKRQLGAGPSSFSNTSRDSMQAAAVAAHAAYTAAQAQSGGSAPIAPNITFIPPPRDGALPAPRRTVSRFREDLPEFPLSPISPSQSRVQSPAADASHPISTSEADNQTSTQGKVPAAEVDRSSPISLQHSSMAPSPEPPSISMASIDSEGSWFGSGIGGGRRRNRMNSLSRYKQQLQQHPAADSSEANNTDDEIGSVEDEDLPSPASHNNPSLRISTGEPIPSSDVEMSSPDEAEATWGTLPRTPTVVHRQAQKMRSSEGLLNSFQDRDDDIEDDKELRADKKDGAKDSEPGSPVSPTSDEEDTGLQRATSINLGRSHARHISAGSAKLLELAPRSSMDSRRLSAERKGAITQ